jgi:hypothetical protein
MTGTAEAMDNLSKAFRGLDEAIGTRDPFEADLHRAMVDVGRGYDPHNHIGNVVIREVLGVDDSAYPDRFTEYTEPGGDSWPDCMAPVNSIDLSGQSPVRVGESVVNMEGGE